MRDITVKDLGRVDYESCYKAMQTFTLSRQAETKDEVWFAEHAPVYTLGMNAKPEHLINTADIPVIKTDRGGQVTYHGPGQLLVYCLFDLKRKSIGVKTFIHVLEESIIRLLQSYDITANRRIGAPGVYIDDRKIAAVGIRLKRFCSYHGLSLNIDMDISPFDGINPCGYRDLQITQLKDLAIGDERQQVIKKLVPLLAEQLQFSYDEIKNFVETLDPKAA